MIRLVVVMVLAYCAAASAGPGMDGSEVSETWGTRAYPSPGLAKPPTSLISLSDASIIAPFSSQVRLGPIDHEALLAEDELNREIGRPARVGVFRPFQVQASDGIWQSVPSGGRVWTLAIIADGAACLRVRFADLSLPPGASIRLGSAVPDAPVDGPITESGPESGAEFWSGLVFGDRVNLEYYDPVSTAGPPSDLPFAVEGVQHFYRNPLAASLPEREGDCHNDVTCWPSWSDVADSVALYVFVDDDSGGSYVCTGQLLDSQKQDQTPYFLTAEHCVGSEPEARSVVCFWRFQAPACEGEPPPILSVPSSSRAQYLAGYAAGDMTLLMLLGELPEGLFWAGWTDASLPAVAQAASVHHPEGTFKRISFGAATSEGGFIRLDWSDGVTEQGSSGAGAFLDATQQLVGVLSGGVSSCTADPWDLWDYFGAFRPAYQQVLAPLLAGGSDDALEPSDDCATVPQAASGFYSDLVVKSTDEDWYRLRADGCGTLSASLVFTDAYGDIDVELYDACGGSVVAFSRGAANTEWLSYLPPAAGDYWLRVYLHSGVRNTYGMQLTLGDAGGVYPVTSGQPIPDASPAGIESTFFVPDHFTIGDLELGLNIAHRYNGDVIVRLVHGATTVTLIDRPGLPPPPFGYSDDGFEVILHDGAPTAIETYTTGGSTVVGSFRPNQALSAFDGMDAYGLWALRVSDVQGSDFGTLNSWALYLQRPPEPGGSCECGGNGDFTGDGDADLADAAGFQRCFTGPGSGPVPPNCAAMNFDCDSDIDLGDFDFLRYAMTGPRQGGPSSTANPAGAAASAP